MKKIKMSRGTMITFEEGCNKYLENCRQRNLREGTIGHYRQSYTYFFKYFDPKMPVEDIDEQTYKDYVIHLKSTLDNDVMVCAKSRPKINFIFLQYQHQRGNKPNKSIFCDYDTENR